MSSVCSSEQNMAAIAADALGYDASRVAKDAETRTMDQFALAVAPYLKFETQSSKWRPDHSDQGYCHLSLILTLPASVAADFGGVSILSSDVRLRMRKTGSGWSLYNEFGDAGIPANGFRDYFRPFASAKAKQTVAEINRISRANDREAALERKRAEAEAEAAFKRDNPREWAAEQERARVEQERRRKERLAQEADERRKAAACEAKGGTWDYKRNQNGMPISATPACYFQISR